MNKQLLTAFVMVVSVVINAQKLQLTEAATEYKNNFSKSWMAQPDQLPKNKAILLKAKNAIDESYGKQMATPSLPAKLLTKMYYYRGMIYLDYLMMAAMDKEILADVESMGEESLNDAAFGSLKKCIELDVKNQWKSYINKRLEGFRAMMFNTGAEMFNQKNYESAYDAFEGAVKIYDVLSKPDTLAMINAAAAAENLKNYDDAYNFYKMCSENNYGKGSEMYQHMLICLYSKKNIDRELCLKIVEEGKSKYPGDYGLSIEEYNLWLNLGEPEKANEAIQNALKLNPKNILLQYNVGILFDKLCTKAIEEKDLHKAIDNFRKAVSSYNKVIEIDSLYLDGSAYYLIGRLHVYIASEIKSSNNFEGEQYQKENDRADNLLIEAYPILERQVKYFPQSKDPLRVLKIIYAQLSMDEDYARIKKLLEN